LSDCRPFADEIKIATAWNLLNAVEKTRGFS